MTLRKHVPDERRARVFRELPLPTDRPATRKETWEHYHAIFFDFKGHRQAPICGPDCNHRSEGELEVYCRDAWVWSYLSWVMRKGWDKQPDWMPGDPVIPGAVLKLDPERPISGNWNHCVQLVRSCHQTALDLSDRRAA